MDNKRYFKITNAQENHHDFQYVDGLNVLDRPFEEEGSCVKGGLYFSDAENILEFRQYGVYLREITLPFTDPDFKMILDPEGKKWRTNKIILGKRYNLSDVSTFELLISLGADIKIYNYYVLRYAAAEGHLDVVKFLINKGANELAYSYAARDACNNGHLEVIKLLVSVGADIHFDNDYFIRKACEKGHLELVKFLVEQGAYFQIYKNCPVQLACSFGHLEVVKYLIEKGADFKEKYNKAISNAVIKGHLDMVKYLVENGADFRAKYYEIMRLATMNNHAEIVEYLTELQLTDKIE